MTPSLSSRDYSISPADNSLALQRRGSEDSTFLSQRNTSFLILSWSFGYQQFRCLIGHAGILVCIRVDLRFFCLDICALCNCLYI